MDSGMEVFQDKGLVMSDPITPLTPQQTAKEESQAAKEGFVKRDLVAGDIFIDELAGGPMDETISTRSGIAASKGSKLGIVMSKFLNIFQKDHGADAAAGDLERAQTEEKIIADSHITGEKNG